MRVDAPNFIGQRLPDQQTCKNLEEPQNIAVFMAPDDGKTRVVLRWGNTPMDLDVYAVPRLVRDWDGRYLEWFNLADEVPEVYSTNGDEDGYAWWYEQAVKGDVADQSYVPKLTLDRDDTEHGVISNKTFNTINGPETVTFDSLMPGRYEVFVNAYPPDANRTGHEDAVFPQQFSVDVYLGDGVSTTRFATTVQVGARGQIWRYIGHFSVYERRRTGCEGVSRLQEVVGLPQQLCYQWITNTDQRQILYPLTGLGFVRVFVESTVPSIAVEDATVQIDFDSRTYSEAEFHAGIQVLQGVHTVTVRAPKFFATTVSVVVPTYVLPAVVNVYLVPADSKTRAILRWGNEPADLDIYAVPRGTLDLNGQPLVWTYTGTGSLPPNATNEDPYAYWDGREIIGQVQGDYVPKISLDRDDTIHGLNGSASLNGPETMTFETLLPGDYQIFVNAWPTEGERESSQVFAGQIEVDIYLGSGADGATDPILADTISWTDPGQVWRYVGNLHVHYQVGGQCPGGRTSRAQVPTVGGKVVCYRWYRVNTLVGYPLRKPGELRLDIVSGTTSEPLPHARVLFDINGIPTSFTAQQNLSGIPLIPGPHTIQVMAKGYVPATFEIIMTDTLNQTFFLIPDDGKTYVVLRWGADPADLDLYVIPIGVSQIDNSGNVTWVDETGGTPLTYSGGESPYVWWAGRTLYGPSTNYTTLVTTSFDVNVTLNATNNVRKPYRTETRNSSRMFTENFLPMIRLDRDDQTHSNSTSNVANGPETVTFENLLPGVYEVYVNAYPPDANRTRAQVFAGRITVEVYLGDSESSTILSDTISFEDPGATWRYIGRIEVFRAGEPCTGITRVQLQDGPMLGLCYKWVVANTATDYPLKK